jgi:hypothetical protein
LNNNRITVLSGFACSVLAILGAIVYVQSHSDDEALEQASQSITKVEQNNAPSAQQTPKEKLTIPGVEKAEDGFEFSEEMKLRLQSVSDAYEDKIQYPDFSLPIKAEELDSKYLSDIPIANETPARLKDPSSPTLSVKTNQFRYQAGDPLTATAVISGLSEDESSMVSARLLSDDSIIAYASVNTINDQAHSYRLDFNELHLSEVNWKKELTVETTFTFGGFTYSRGNAIEYVSTMASIDDIATAEVENEYLSIPVYVSTQKPGYHRIKGNLYDANSGEPLLHLRAEGELTSNGELLTLRAHITALKAAGSEGPYELKDLSLTRLPSKPDYITEFGQVDQQTYSIEGYSFNEYIDKPYINEKSQKIAKELRRLGT